MFLTPETLSRMLDRFYIPGAWPSDVVALSESEAHHLSHVLRKQRGDHVEIFDGQGRSAKAEVVSVSRRIVEVRIFSQPHAAELERASGVWLAVAPPKGDRLKLMIEKLTEIGVERIILLNTERSVVQPSEAKLDKLEQVAIAACKQCRRNTLPQIVQSATIDGVLDSCGTAASLWLADRLGDGVSTPVDKSGQRHCCFVGPEGGFADGELAQLDAAGTRKVSLGPHVLRVETAAVLAAGWLIARIRAE